MVEKIGQEAMNDVEKLKEKIGGIFQEFDKDGSRGIDEIELRQGMKELGITLNDNEVKTMLKFQFSNWKNPIFLSLRVKNRAKKLAQIVL